MFEIQRTQADKNVDDDDISSSRMSYPELEIAEPTGDMVKCWKDVWIETVLVSCSMHDTT